MTRAVVVVALLLAAAPAHAERPWHGRLGAGSGLAFTGSGGDRLRYELALDLEPRSRYGLTLGWRQFDEDHRGLLVAGLLYEAAAARPRLTIDFHADVGIDLDDPHPLIAGGLRTTVGIVGPFAVVLDLTPYLVLGNYRALRLQITGAALLALAF